MDKMRKTKLSIDDIFELSGYIDQGFAPPWPQRFDDWHPKLRNAICTCGGTVYGGNPYGFNWPEPGNVSVCKRCRKPGHWQLKFCHICYEFFIKCFYHPAYRDEWTCCYECLEACYPDYENPVLLPVIKAKGKRPPWIRKYKYTLEFVEANFTTIPKMGF